MKDEKLFSLGIEEEFQIVDPATRELRSHVESLVGGSGEFKSELKRELHQSVIEIGTKVCHGIDEARSELIKLRSGLAKAAQNAGMTIAAAGTHPISHWSTQEITDDPRYQGLLEELQMTARSNLIFGLHVHVGIPDREVAIQVMNSARYFLPHCLALSTNSPFWVGRLTGFKSYRVKVFDRFPRTGLPGYFESLSEYEDFLKLLVKSRCIDNAKKIWWDMRLHPFFDTLEYRVCDVPMRVEESLTLAALFQAITAKLYKMTKQNTMWRIYRSALLNENKWRASRYGIQGKLIDLGKQEEVDFKDLATELLEFVDDVVDELEIRPEIEGVEKMLREGTGADRQLQVYRDSGRLEDVVDYIIRETHTGLTVPAPAL